MVLEPEHELGRNVLYLQAVKPRPASPPFLSEVQERSFFLLGFMLAPIGWGQSFDRDNSASHWFCFGDLARSYAIRCRIAGAFAQSCGTALDLSCSWSLSLLCCCSTC